MPLSTLADLTTLKTQARAFIRTRFQNRGTNDGQFLGKLAYVVGMALFGLQRTAEQIDRDSPPNAKSSALGLANWAFSIGVPSNGGGYGPNVAEPATGGEAPVTGTTGIVVNGGQQLTAPDGVTIIELNTTGTIPFTGTFSAVTPGTVGNLEAGTKLTWVSPPSGCDPTVILSDPLVGGLDVEQPKSILDRILARWQTPPKGGANIDFKTWAEEQLGILTAFVYPRRSGTGTVDVVITSAGSGTGRSPSNAAQAAVQSFIASIAPTNIETINIFKPYQPAGNALGIRIRAVLAPKYSWDWDDTNVSYTVSAYSAGGPTLTLNTPAPASLQSAIAAGANPRIQVVNTANGAPVIPDTRRVTAIDVTNTILTLDSALTVAPNTGDAIYAGSYVAPLVATAVLAYVDSVGPSRASGLADTITVWDDTVAIFRIAETVLDQVDTDGVTRMVTNILSGGVTIAVGAGGPAATDYRAPDDGINAPQLATAARVYCTQ